MSKKIKVAVIIGTRPDIIKMAVVISKLEKHPLVSLSVITTAQHRQMLDQMLKVFSISVDFDLNIMKEDQGLPEVSGRMLVKLADVIKRSGPDMVLVQGDTATAFMGSLAAFYNKVSIGHIEAGLRTHDKYQPYPEEINRRLISSLSDLHFAPTKTAKDNLLREGVDNANIYVTGNTVIDALLMTASRRKRKDKRLDGILRKAGSNRHKIILVTAHRRENWGEPLRDICSALKELVSLHSDIVIIYSVHLNPNIREPVYKALSSTPRVFLVPPLDYQQFVGCLSKSYLVITDSGGIQEEAPSLGVPVLVLREVTERPEAVREGAVKVIGTKARRICSEVDRLLNDRKKYERMARAVNPYGDGKAADRIVKALLHHFNLSAAVPSEFNSKLQQDRR